MTPEQFARVEAEFEVLSDLPPGECAERLSALVKEDPEVGGAVAAMLEEDARDSDFLERPVHGAQLPLERILSDALEDGAAELPKRIGRFEILGRLGSGGMGTVYLAGQDEPRRRVAVKVLHPTLSSSRHRRRFRREARLLARLKHPGIAQVYESGVHGGEHGQPYLAMELVEGLPLAEFVRKHELDVRARVRLVAEVCDAVHHAHEQGVVHRDLKPDNVLVVAGAGPSGEALPKVLDFGIACAADTEESLATFQTTEGQVLGTLAYMSPEQAASAPVDRRTDVYSLGAILFHLLSGRLPHDIAGQSLPSALRKIQEEDPTRLALLDSRLRGDLDTICARALEADPERRYATAAALAADLRRFLNHEPITAHAPSSMYRLRKFARRNRALVGGVVSTMLVLAAGTAVSSTFAVRSARNARAAEHERNLARRESYRASLDAARAMASVDPAAARGHLEQASPDLRGWEWEHLVRSLDGSVVVASPERDAVKPLVQDTAYRPDGVALWAYASAEPDGVRLVELTGLQVSVHLPAPGPVRSVALAPDGIRLAAIVGAEARLVVWDLERPDAPRETGLGLVGVSLRFGNDGSTLSVADEGGSVVVVDARDLGTRLAASPPSGIHRRAAGSLVMAPGAEGASLYYGLLNLLNRLSGEGPPLFSDAEQLGETERGFGPWRGPIGCATSTALEVSPDGAWLARGCDRNAVILHSAVDLGIERVLDWSGAAVVDLAFAPDGQRLVGIGPQGAVVWETSSGVPTQRLGLGGERVALGRDGGELCIASADGARIWRLEGQTPLVLRGHQRRVLSVAFSSDGALLASGGGGEFVHLWDVLTGQELARYSVRQVEDEWEHEVHGLCFDASGTRLIVAHKNQAGSLTVYLTVRDLLAADGPGAVEVSVAPLGIGNRSSPFWAVATPGARASRKKISDSVALSSSGRLWARADDRLVQVWEAGAGEDGKPLVVLATEPGAEPTYENPAAIALHPDETLVASGHRDGWLRVWDLATGRERASLRLDRAVHALDFHPGGARLAVSGGDGIVRIHRVDDLKELITLRGHSDSVHALRFSPDGTRLVSASADAELVVWDSVPLLVREAERRAAAELRESMRPRVQRARARVGPGTTVAERLRGDAELRPEERAAALQLLLRQERSEALADAER